MFCKAFARDSSANIKLSKTQMSKILQLGGFLDRLKINTKNWLAFNEKYT